MQTERNIKAKTTRIHPAGKKRKKRRTKSEVKKKSESIHDARKKQYEERERVNRIGRKVQVAAARADGKRSRRCRVEEEGKRERAG